MDKRILLLVVALAALALYAGVRHYRGSLPYEWSGTVEAHTIAVGSRTGGRVKEVLAREGELVKQGQSLVVLEEGDLRAQRLIAESEDGVQCSFGS